MPIKFRCQHCQQLLGISRSRAGAVVDCPRCGRSLRVPDLDGSTQRLPDPQATVREDSALMSALAELSVLNETSSEPISDNSAASAGDQPPHKPAIQLAPVARPEPVQPAVAVEMPMTEPEPVEDEPVAIEESLEQLAALGLSSETSAVSETLLADMRTASGPRPGLWTLVVVAAAVFIAGLLVGRWTLPHLDTMTAADNSSVDAAPDVDGTADNKAAIPEATGRPNESADEAGEMILSGSVVYSDASGMLRPDAGAVILLLPTERIGTLMLNARSLQRPVDHPDRRAVTAALNVLGGSMTQADSDGQFRLPATTKQMMSLVVVSKHQERPDDVAVPEPVLDLLRNYFDSTTHVCGRRAVQLVNVDPTTEVPKPIDVRFTARQ
ncbi:MAG: hypothetical protein RIK87_21715 [Fuerstiella sp.]